MSYLNKNPKLSIETRRVRKAFDVVVRNIETGATFLVTRMYRSFFVLEALSEDFKKYRKVISINDKYEALKYAKELAEMN